MTALLGVGQNVPKADFGHGQMVKPRLSSECQVLHLEEIRHRSSPDVFQQQGLRDLSGSGEKIRVDQSTETSLRKTCSRALGTSD